MQRPNDLPPGVHMGANVGEAQADDLDVLVRAITSVEAIVAGWDPGHSMAVEALKSAVEALHKEALRRLIRTLKDDPAAGAKLREALSDPVIYGVLRHHGLIKQSLNARLQEALEEVRPTLAGHGGDVELVAIRPPDTVDLRLVGSCHGCPASGQTMSEGIEKAIKAHCPEIIHVNQVSRSAVEAGAATGNSVQYISPFALHVQSGWLDAGSIAAVPDGGVLAVSLKGRSLLLSRRGIALSCFDNACAHLGMPLDTAEVNGGVITCSYHGFQYLLETGECLTAPEVQLRVHGVRVLGDRIQVRLED